MRVMWLGKQVPFCGNVTYSKQITQMLEARGYQIHFLAQESLACFYQSQIYTWPSLEAAKQFQKQLAEFQPHVLHVSLTLSPLDFLLPEISPVPLVATFHPPFTWLPNLMQQQVATYVMYAPFLSRYHAIIVFSPKHRQLLLQLGIPDKKIVCIPNGIDHYKYRPSYGKGKQEQNDCVFIYQGRISVEKNLPALLKAWKQQKMGWRAQLWLIGYGAQIRGLMHHYTAADGIRWLGVVKNENRRIHMIHHGDVFMLPSWVEGLSLALLEAFSCGLVCIATDAGADAEVLEPNLGVVLNPKQVNCQLEGVLPLLVEQAELRKLLSHKSREKLLRKYALMTNVLYLDFVYRSVKGDPQGDPQGDSHVELDSRPNI
jgi:glycosyltransferase involved in cell wall biosynthesis